jgi:DNA (cytosine-5)-methyltransferase 1
MTNEQIEVVSLFSGCGGLDLGFEQAGFKTVYANEYDNRVAPTYEANFPGVPMDTRDVRSLRVAELPPFRGIIGSPPCQSWSSAGAHRGAEDPRGRLFFVYADLIQEAQPEFFAAENVAGMLQGAKQEVFQYLIGVLQGCGYHVSYKLVDCANYGVPQNRERVFIVGLRKDKYKSAFEFPEPTAERTTLRDAIGDLPAAAPAGGVLLAPSHEYATGGWSSNFMSRQRVRSWDEQSYTIPASGRHVPLHPSANKMLPAGKDKFIFDPESPLPYRRLSVRECARIQTFPDDHKLVYDSVTAGYLMVGNAVPVKMARTVAGALIGRLRAGE